jgi:diguanylate cyclase (GGDEF)-like protein/hemerythrin-like metal-binding protein
MIDALTLNFALIVLSTVYFLMSLIIYNIRREKYLLYYSLTFITLTLTYVLLLYQKSFPDWFSFVFTNILVALSQLFIVISVRLLYKLKPIEPRFFVLIVVLAISLVFFTYNIFSLSYRVITLSLYMSINLIDLLIVTNKHKHKVHANINKIISTVLVLSSFVWLTRIVFALTSTIQVKYLVDQGVSTAAYYLIAMVTVSIWFSLFIWLDSTQSVNVIEQKNVELSELALVDNLTNLSNRHYFDHDIEFLIATTIRNKSKLTLLMIDLDRFKLVNDTFGHLVGDSVLKQTAQILKNSVRATDRVYRWGGEEFIIITPETSNSQATHVAEKICQNFREAKFDVIGSITVSVGLASYDENESTKDWINRADLALYQAKQTGRDKWVAWLDDEQLPSHFSRFIWTEEFVSGNAEVDNDHKLLAEYVNHLHDLIVNQYPIDTIRDHIFKMNHHIQNHFTHEEAIIKKLGYVDYLEHRAIHQRILSEYEIIVKKAINGDISLGAIMSYLVEKVLLGHILHDDKQFFDLIKK